MLDINKEFPLLLLLQFLSDFKVLSLYHLIKLQRYTLISQFQIDFPIVVAITLICKGEYKGG